LIRPLSLTLLFLQLILFASFESEAQSPSNQKVTIKQLLDQLRNQGYKIAYSDNFLVIDETIEVAQQNYTISQVLDLICGNRNLEYEIIDFDIIIKPKKVKKYTISGRIFDQKDGEALIGVNVTLLNSEVGIVSNAYGFYALTLDPGQYQLVYSHIGYSPIVFPIDLSSSKKIDIKLNPSVKQLQELIITDRNFEFEIESLETGTNKVDMEVVSEIPYLMGEVDVFQAALLLPGVRNIGEDASGLNIRGGSVDQNLILLDEATIYNSNHFYGLISVFNPDAIKDVVIYKGGVPSTYGGRVSSTIHVRQKEGNNQETKISGGLGLVSGRILVEGPIRKDKSSFLFSTRTSFLNYIAAISADPNIRNSSTNFQDLNAKINFRPNYKNHIYISAYGGVDNSNDQLLFNSRWGNRTITLRWNRLISDKLFSNFTLVHSNYKYKINNPDGIGEFFEESTIRDYSAKSDFTWFINPKVNLEFGAGTIFHRLSPGDRVPINDDNPENAIQLDTEHGIEPYLYSNLQYNISEKLVFHAGLRSTALINFGPDDVYTYLPNVPKSLATRVDTVSFGKFEPVNTFYALEPRLSFTYSLANDNSIKASFNRSSQFIHLISNTVSPSPTDIWKLSDDYISPTFSSQIGLGYYKKWREKNIDFFVETYYKTIENIIEYKEGASLLFNESIETELLQGNARAYGLELLLRKNFGKLSGWVSYNLSRTERKIDGLTLEEKINGGRYFPADFDRTHDFSLSSMYRLNERWSFSGNFLFSTGRPITLPDGKYQYEGIVIPSFSDRNQFRISNYHRLDLSAKLLGKKYKSDGSIRKNNDFWTFTLFNVYSRRNAYSYLFRQQEGSDLTEVVRYSILGSIIPSVTYNFKF
jgi:hypothetical protein